MYAQKVSHLSDPIPFLSSAMQKLSPHCRAQCGLDAVCTYVNMMGLWVYFCWQTEIMGERERKYFVSDLKLYFWIVNRVPEKLNKKKKKCFHSFAAESTQNKNWEEEWWKMTSWTLPFCFLPITAMLLHFHDRGESKLVHRLLFHFIARQLLPALITNFIYFLFRRRAALGGNYSWLILAQCD